MGFKWMMFGRWLLAAFGILGASFFLMGLPGAIVYEGWRLVLNLLFRREVIADTAPLGPGAWALAITVAVQMPWGLPIGYLLTTGLSRSWVRSLPHPLNSRIAWILLAEVGWTLLVVCLSSGYAQDAAKDSPFRTP